MLYDDYRKSHQGSDRQSLDVDKEERLNNLEEAIDDVRGDSAIPDQVTGSRAKGLTSGIEVSCDRVDEAGVTEYHFYRGSTPNSSSRTTVFAATVLQPPDGERVSWVDPTGTDDIWYWIRAIKGLYNPKIEGQLSKPINSRQNNDLVVPPKVTNVSVTENPLKDSEATNSVVQATLSELTFSYTKPNPLGTFEFVEIWVAGHAVFGGIALGKKAYPALFWSSDREQFNATLPSTGQLVAFFFVSANRRVRRDLIIYEGTYRGPNGATAILIDPGANFLTLYGEGTVEGEALDDLIINVSNGTMYTISQVVSPTELTVVLVPNTGESGDADFDDGDQFIICAGPYATGFLDGVVDVPGRVAQLKSYRLPQAARFVATRRAERNIKQYNLYRKPYGTTVATGTHTGSSGSTTSLTDSAANFTGAGVAIGDLIYNVTDGSYWYVTAVTSSTVLAITLINPIGTDNDFDTGNAYKIFRFSGTTLIRAVPDTQVAGGLVSLVDDATEDAFETNSVVNSEYMYFVTAINTSDKEGLPNMVYGAIGAEVPLTPSGINLLMNADFRLQDPWDNWWVIATTLNDETQAASADIEMNSVAAYEDAAGLLGAGDAVHIEDGVRDLIVDNTSAPIVGPPQAVSIPASYGGFSLFDHGPGTVMNKNARVRLIGKSRVTGSHNGAENNASLVDVNKNFVTLGVKTSWIVFNDGDASFAAITSISTTTNPNDTLNGPLANGPPGADNNWDLGDAYRVLDAIVPSGDHAIWKADDSNIVKFVNGSEIMFDQQTPQTGYRISQRIVVGPRYPYVKWSTHNISSSTNATPIVVTTSTVHNLVTGMRVYISGHTTNTNANGVRYVKYLSDTIFELYSNSTLTTAVAGNGVGGATGTVVGNVTGNRLIPKAGDTFCIAVYIKKSSDGDDASGLVVPALAIDGHSGSTFTSSSIILMGSITTQHKRFYAVIEITESMVDTVAGAVIGMTLSFSYTRGFPASTRDVYITNPTLNYGMYPVIEGRRPDDAIYDITAPSGGGTPPPVLPIQPIKPGGTDPIGGRDNPRDPTDRFPGRKLT